MRPLPVAALTAPLLLLALFPAVSAQAQAPTEPKVTAPDAILVPGALPLLTLSSRPPLVKKVAAHSSSVQSSTPFTYDLHIIAFSTADGPSGVTAGNAPLVVGRVDQEYSRETGGMYRFRYVGLTVVPTSSKATPCEVDVLASALKAYLPSSTPTPGANAVDWVIVTPFSAACNYNGQAATGSAGVHLNGGWQATSAPQVGDGLMDVHTLVHELGHNLGLYHAGDVATDGTTQPIKAGSPFTISEYGDGSDTMGSNNSLLRFNAYDRDILGLLPASSLDSATSGTSSYTLQAIDSPTGTTSIYVTSFNHRAYQIDYRPSVGSDNIMFKSGGGVIVLHSGAGAGVYVRALGAPADLGGAPYYPASSSLVLPPGQTPNDNGQRLGLLTGEHLLLPDGTDIHVTSESSSSAALSVTRPVDSTPPSVPAGPCGPAASCVISSVTPRIFYASFDPKMDKGWVTGWGVKVDGVDVTKVTSPPAASTYATMLVRKSSFDLSYTVPPGSHQVTLWATDASGNTTNAVTSINLKDTVAPTLSLTRPNATTHGKVAFVTWVAKDVGSGVASIQLRWARGSVKGGKLSAWVYPKTWASLTGKQVNTSVALSWRYCYSGRARDKSGNFSAWTTPKCTVVTK